MARFLEGLFGARDLERKSPDTDRRASAGAGYVFSGNPYIPNWDVDRMVRDGYEKVIPVFRAIDAIADKISSWPIKVMEGDEPDWKKVEDPIADLLNQRANTIDGAAKFFRYRLVTQFLVSKKGVFVEAIPNKAGDAVAAMNLLPPALTYLVPSEVGVPESVEVWLPNGERPRIPMYNPDTKRGVLWIRKPHPTNPYMGVSPLEPMGISIDLDFYARLYNRNFLLNDGRSGQLVAIKGGLSPDDAAELKARFSPGMSGVGRTTIIEADAVTVNDTAVTPRDAQYAELRELSEKDLLMGLGTPRSVLGDASDRTFDNADAEKESWLIDTVMPIADTIATGFDPLTAGGYDDDRQVVHDAEAKEPVLGRAKRLRQDKAREDFDAGRITLRMLAEILEVDLPSEDMVGVDVFWLNINGRIPLGEDDAVEAALKLQPVGMAPPTDQDGLPEDQLDENGQPIQPALGAGPQPAGELSPWTPEADTFSQLNQADAGGAVTPIDRSGQRTAVRAQEAKGLPRHRLLLVESDDPADLERFMEAAGES